MIPTYNTSVVTEGSTVRIFYDSNLIAEVKPSGIKLIPGPRPRAEIIRRRLNQILRTYGFEAKINNEWVLCTNTLHHHLTEPEWNLSR